MKLAAVTRAPTAIATRAKHAAVRLCADPSSLAPGARHTPVMSSRKTGGSVLMKGRPTLCLVQKTISSHEGDDAEDACRSFEAGS